MQHMHAPKYCEPLFFTKSKCGMVKTLEGQNFSDFTCHFGSLANVSHSGKHRKFASESMYPNNIILNESHMTV